MPFSEPFLSLADILDAIAAIEQFTKDMDFDAFREDPKTIAAVERKLQVMSEAVRLADQTEALTGNLPPLKIAVNRALNTPPAPPGLDFR